MQQAKAIINLKEGIIELEGPVDFVREYLAVYGPAGNRLVKSDSDRVRKGTIGKKKLAIGRKAGRANRAACGKAIRAELEAGFFNEARSPAETNRRLTEKGLSCPSNNIRLSMKELTESGQLTRTGAGRGIRYQRSR